MTPEEQDDIARKVYAEIDEAPKTSEAVAEASARWSECMAAEGYDYADPHEAMDDFIIVLEEDPDGSRTIAWENPVQTDEEKQVALQDATCKEEVGFWDVVKKVKLDAETAIVERMLPQLEQVKAAREAETNNERAIIASAGATP
jgi:hypothetical protein